MDVFVTARRLALGKRGKMPATPLLALVLLLAAAAAAQDFLGSSVVRNCLSVSYGDVNLDCAVDQSATVVLLNAAASSAQSTYHFELRSLPPPGKTQTTAANVCQVKDDDGLCTVSSRVDITVEVSPTVARWRLNPLIDGPESVPYVYRWILKPISSSSNELDTDVCYLASVFSTDVTSSVAGQGFVDNVFLFPVAGESRYNYLQCPFVGDEATKAYYTEHSKSLPNQLDLSDYTNAQLHYIFQCRPENGKDYYTLDVVGEMISYGPMGSVYSINSRPDNVAVITVKLRNIDTGEEQKIVLDSGSVSSAARSEDGKMMVKIVDINNPSLYFGPYLTGNIILANRTCDETTGECVSNRFSMVPRGTSPLKNPWPKNANFSYRWPSTEWLARLEGLNLQDGPTVANVSFMYINGTFTNTIGECCGCYGVTQDIFLDNPAQLFINGFSQLYFIEKEKSFFEKLASGFTSVLKILTTFNAVLGGAFKLLDDFVKKAFSGEDLGLSPGLRRFQLANLNQYCTCVPGMGLCTPFGLTAQTMCNANQEFDRANFGDLTQRQQRYRNDLKEKVQTQFATPLWTPEEPNIWIDEPYMYAEIDTPSTFQIMISTVGSFAGITSTTAPATIDDRTTSCNIRRNSSERSTLGVTVCNAAPTVPARFTVFTTCEPSSVLSVAEGGVTHIDDIVQPARCVTVTQLLNILVPTFTGAATCTVRVGPEGATPLAGPNDFLVLDKLDVSCTVATTPLPTPVGSARLDFNGSYVAQNITIGATESSFTSIITWIVAGVTIFLLVVFGIVFGTSAYIYYQKQKLGAFADASK